MAQSTEPPRLARTFDMVSSTPVGNTRSSGSNTAMASSSGSSFSSTHPTAWPSPSGSCWTTDSTLISPVARRTFSSITCLPRASSVPSRIRSWTKCATTPSLPSEVTMIRRSPPASAASAATSSIPGVSTTGSNSFGTVLVAGRKRVPRPAAGTTAVRGIGTRGGVIVHTLTSLAWLNLARLELRRLCSVCEWAVIVDAVTGLTKTELRAEMLLARRTLAPQLHDAEAHALCGHLPAFIGAGETVCAYVPVGSEPGSAELIDSLLRRGVRVLLPVARHDAAGLPVPLHCGEDRPEALVQAG